MSASEWDGVERRRQDHNLWAALDGYDSQLDKLRNQQRMTHEELFVLRQSCMECRPKKRSTAAIAGWVLTLAALAWAVAVLA